MKKLLRYWPFLFVILIYGALIALYLTMPGKSAWSDQGITTTVATVIDQVTPDVPSAVPRSAPAIPIVAADEPPQTPIAKVTDLMYGQQVYINEGARYYETADFSGSGRYGTIGNQYTQITRISGFARVNPETGRLLASEAYTRDEVPVGRLAPDFVQDCPLTELWVALCTEGFTTGDVGWVSIYEVNWLDGELDIPPSTEDDLSNPYCLTDDSHSHPKFALFVDTAYAISPDKCMDFTREFFWGDSFRDATQRSGSTILQYDGQKNLNPDYQPGEQLFFYAPYPDDLATADFNTWIDTYPSRDYVDKPTQRQESEQLVNSHNCPFETLWGRPCLGYEDTLIIITDTHARRFDGLTPRDYFDRVIVIDVSPSYQIDPEFETQITAAYGPLSDITAADLDRYRLNDFLDAFC